MADYKVKNWRQKTKKRLIDGFGGCCNRCGYDVYHGSMDFHHIDPSEKSFSISQGMKNPKKWNDLVEEVKKCVLLCNRCHHELHGEIWSLEDIKIIPFSGHKDKLKKETQTGSCPICLNPVYLNRICCSRSCSGKRSRSKSKTKWPEIDLLLKMISESNKSQVANKLGVSETAVRKHLKKHGCY